MTLAAAWLLFPLILSLLALGCGLLLEVLTGKPLPGVLLLPAGIAMMIVVAEITTFGSSTAKLTIPAVLAIAIAGYGLSWPWRRRLDYWAVGAALAVFAVYAAPVVLSGSATFAGYIKLDDTSTWLGITDHVLNHGRSVAGLAPSSYQRTLGFYLVHTGYPFGSFVPLGIAGKLTPEDIAWLFQPYVAFLGVMLGLGLYALVEPLVPSRRLRALVVFVGAQPALLYGYSLWGGVKEVAGAFLLVLLVALVAPLLGSRVRARSVLPILATIAAIIGALSVGGAAYIAPVVVPALAVGAIRFRRAFSRATAVRAAAAGALILGLVVPSLLVAGGFLSRTNLRSRFEINQLGRPLSGFQLFGIWPNGDFRFKPSDMVITYSLISIVLLATTIAIAFAVRRRAWGLVIYVVTAAVTSALIVNEASPWVAGKAFATASPAFPAAGMVCAAVLLQRRRRLEALVLAVAVAGGVLWSNVLAYHEVWLAPRDQLLELQHIGQRFAGDGPTLMTEYQPYGALHFLRAMDPESASEYRVRPVALRIGGLVPEGGYADLDEFTLDAILVYRTLVLDRSPVESRPPFVYQLVSSGRYYEVWQRPEQPPTILEHLPLGSPVRPAAVPSCAEVLRVAAVAHQAAGVVVAVPRQNPIVVRLADAAHPADWHTTSDGSLYTKGAGTITAQVNLTRPGSYGVWLGGSFPARMEAFVDGRLVGSARGRLSHPGQYTEFGKLSLPAGEHTVELRYSGPSWRPGSAARLGLPLGPFVLSLTDADLPFVTVQPTDARTLCGRSLDWIEAVTQVGNTSAG